MKTVDQFICPSCDLTFWINNNDLSDFIPTCPRCGHQVLFSNELNMLEDNADLLKSYWSTFYNIKIFDHYTCPRCEDGDLVIRHGRDKKKFWGCTNYPKCKYSQNLSPEKSREVAVEILDTLLDKEKKHKSVKLSSLSPF